METLSEKMFERSKKVIPGGVNSPARAFSSVKMEPPFIKRGDGTYIFDEEDNRYIDFVGSWGPLILGHCDKDVVDGLHQVIKTGTSFGAPTAIEMKMAELMVDSLPNIDMVRMVNSGTEATMSAVRLAKAYTKRNKIIKFEGNYHGHSEGFLIKAGSGALTHGVPDSLGVPAEIAKHTLTASFNNLESVENIFKANPEEIAAVIVEPVAGNMGVIAMEDDFAKGLRQITDKYGTVLIFDEVMTGFRVGFKGAHELYPDIKPDITCYGKIIGGGLPVGAFGGKQQIMSLLAPIGPVYQAGTLSGNPLAMRAGYETLLKLRNNPQIYDKLDKLALRLEKGIREAAKLSDIDITVNRVGGMISMFFTDKEVKNFEDVSKADNEQFIAYFKEMLNSGVYLPPSQFESLFLNAKMDNEHIDFTIEKARDAFKKLTR
ncbi:glutamate-1-semialdehyde 2,1-aminomutase [Proteinivorax tanatarense]|uniref:Glutamate-1-semialdehyde 2,1-aminomutase n=1 Tax=Proteinivorax tanatarense TaxID=1260629 RepID=A0AAU7VKE1_9FIRM